MRVLDELVAVTVAGDHDDVVATSLALGGEGGQHVVGLEATDLVDRQVERLDDLADKAHLLAQDVGRLLAAGLVVIQHHVPERRLRPVEGDCEQVGALFVQEVLQHRGEPEHGVRDLA